MLVWLHILRRLVMRLLTECQLDKAKTACQPIILLYLTPETLRLTISANSLGHKLAQGRVHKVGDDPYDLLGPLLHPGGHVHLDHGLDDDALGFVFLGDRLRPEETALFGTEPVELEVAFRRYVSGFIERLEGVNGRGRTRTVVVGYESEWCHGVKISERVLQGSRGQPTTPSTHLREQARTATSWCCPDEPRRRRRSSSCPSSQPPGT
jgi:hypothetical protein